MSAMQAIAIYIVSHSLPALIRPAQKLPTPN